MVSQKVNFHNLDTCQCTQFRKLRDSRQCSQDWSRLGFVSALSRLCLGFVSALSRLRLGFASATSRLSFTYASTTPSLWSPASIVARHAITLIVRLGAQYILLYTTYYSFKVGEPIIPTGRKHHYNCNQHFKQVAWVLTNNCNIAINNYHKFKLLFNSFGLSSARLIVISIYNNEQRNIVRVIGSRL